MSDGQRRALWLVLQATGTIVLLGFLVRGLDLAAMRALLGRTPAWFYLLSLAVVLGGQVAYAWRWHVLLSAAGADVPFATTLRQYFVGTFINNFMPSTVGGDVAKVYYLGREHGYRVVTASIAVDRVIGVGLLAAVASVALWVSPVRAARLNAAMIASLAVALVAAVVMLLAVSGTGGLAARVAPLGERAVRLAERVQRLRLDMAAALKGPAVILQALAVVGGYALAVTLLYMRFIAIEHVTAPPLVATLAAVTSMMVLSNVPITLNGVGLREQLNVSLLAPLGVAPEVAVAISLLLYAHTLIASLIGFAYWRQQVFVQPNVTDAAELPWPPPSVPSRRAD